MLGRAKKKTPTLETVDAVQARLARLPKADPLSTLQELAGMIDRLYAGGAIAPSHAYAIADLLDRTGRPCYRKVSHDYILGQKRLTRFQDDLLWNAVAGYLAQLAHAYRFCLAQYEVGAAGGAGSSSHVPLITSRAIRTGGTRLKWSYLRYRPKEPGLWRELNGLYLFAQEAGFARTPMLLYRGATQQSTAEQEFLKALLLEVVSPGSLPAEGVEVAERLMAQCIGEAVLSTHTPDQLPYCVELKSDDAPRRLPASRKMSRTGRAFGACRAVDHLVAIAAKLDDASLTPRALGLTGEFPVETIQATIRHLVRYWTSPLPSRQHERHARAARISVLHEFDEILANLGGLMSDYPFVSDQEEWLVENHSQGGLHAVVPSLKGQWVRVGSLIAYREGDDAMWRIGVVRRMERDEDDSRSVAIETLAAGGSGVTIVPLPRAKKQDTTPGFRCALLSRGRTVSDEIVLLLPPGTFSTTAAREMRAYDRAYVLIPLQLVEEGDGYQIARFKVLKSTV